MDRNITQIEFEFMVKSRIDELIKYLIDIDIVRDEIDADNFLSNTKTYKYLTSIEFNFYWKSIENLVYLLKMEIQNNDEEWNLNA